MKQGKSLMELGAELTRQRNNRQDFIADTKSLEVQTDSNGNSQIFFYLDDNPHTFGINENAHSQISAGSAFLIATINVCKRKLPNFSITTSTLGWRKHLSVV